MAKIVFLSAPRATGDHIVCNGLYRHYANKYDLCIIAVKNGKMLNVTSMLSDLHNILYINFPDFIARKSTRVAAYLFEKLKFDVVRLGLDGKDYPSKSSMTWDRNFYQQVSIDFDVRWEGFFAPRNFAKENKLYDLLNCGSGDYAFVHDDPSRGFVIDSSYINPRIKIIKPTLKIDNFSIFDYRKILENAKEIHCIESSFSALIESINLKKPLYAHRYARPEVIRDPWFAYSYRLDWNIILK